MSRFFLSAAFASRPSKAVSSWEHLVHCRVFLEVLTFIVAGFKRFRLYPIFLCCTNPMSALLTSSVLLLYLSSLLWGRLLDSRRLNADWEWTDTCSFQDPKWSGFVCLFAMCQAREIHLFFSEAEASHLCTQERSPLPPLPAPSFNKNKTKLKYHPFALTFPLGAVTNEQCWNMTSLLTRLFLSVTNNLFLANCPDYLNQSSVKS